MVKIYWRHTRVEIYEVVDKVDNRFVLVDVKTGEQYHKLVAGHQLQIVNPETGEPRGGQEEETPVSTNRCNRSWRFSALVVQ